MISAPTNVSRSAKQGKARAGQTPGGASDAAAVLAHVKALGLSARAGLQRTLSEAQINMGKFAEKAGARLQDNPTALHSPAPGQSVPPVIPTKMKGLAVQDERVLSLIGQAVEEYAAADHATTPFNGFLKERLRAAGYNANARLMDGRV